MGRDLLTAHPPSFLKNVGLPEFGFPARAIETDLVLIHIS